MALRPLPRLATRPRRPPRPLGALPLQVHHHHIRRHPPRPRPRSRPDLRHLLPHQADRPRIRQAAPTRDGTQPTPAHALARHLLERASQRIAPLVPRRRPPHPPQVQSQRDLHRVMGPRRWPAHLPPLPHHGLRRRSHPRIRRHPRADHQDHRRLGILPRPRHRRHPHPLRRYPLPPRRHLVRHPRTRQRHSPHLPRHRQRPDGRRRRPDLHQDPQPTAPRHGTPSLRCPDAAQPRLHRHRHLPRRVVPDLRIAPAHQHPQHLDPLRPRRRKRQVQAQRRRPRLHRHDPHRSSPRSKLLHPARRDPRPPQPHRARRRPLRPTPPLPHRTDRLRRIRHAGRHRPHARPPGPRAFPLPHPPRRRRHAQDAPHRAPHPALRPTAACS